MGIMCIRTVAKNKKTKQAMNDYIVLEQNSTQKNNRLLSDKKQFYKKEVEEK